MYDMYRHLKLTPYRAMIPKDAPFPSERHAQNWRKVGTIESRAAGSDAGKAITNEKPEVYRRHR
jgi:hypothetical protein